MTPRPHKQAFLTAVSLRNIFTTIVILAILGTGGVFYYALSRIQTYSTTVHQDVMTAHLSSPVTLAPKTAPTGDSALVSSFFASPSNYQAQVTKDLSTYASLTGIPLSAVTPISSGDMVSVTFKGAVSYSNLVTFLTYVEHNLPKLEIQSLGLARNPKDPATVTVTSLQIMVVTQ